VGGRCWRGTCSPSSSRAARAARPSMARQATSDRNKLNSLKSSKVASEHTPIDRPARTRNVPSRAVSARMSAHETTPGHLASTLALMVSMASKPRREFTFGSADFSPPSSRRIEPSQPCSTWMIDTSLSDIIRLYECCVCHVQISPIAI
jgi:hypothetical protein